MHELGLCDALLKKISEIAEENSLSEVYSVTLEIGSLSGVVPAFMTDCWKAVTDGTAFAKTELNLTTETGEAECLDCGEVFPADPENPVCPHCGGRKLNPLSGRGLTILSVEGS